MNSLLPFLSVAGFFSCQPQYRPIQFSGRVMKREEPKTKELTTADLERIQKAKIKRQRKNDLKLIKYIHDKGQNFLIS